MRRRGAADHGLCHDRIEEHPDHDADQRAGWRDGAYHQQERTLKKGRGYFKPETYTLSFSKEGYKPVDITVRGSVNGWYFGNVIFGGLIGLLAVDPATGAMYTLQPKEVAATLDALKVARDGREQTLTVLLVKEVPKEYVGQLVPIAAD